MKEYKIVENIPSVPATETMLNELSSEGWVVVSFGQFQICLERDKQNEEQTVGQING